MGVTSYLTVQGEILSETLNGVESDYVPDPLGSTAELINYSQTITDRFFWWPYGELRSHPIGTSVTPFGYGGALGYHTDASSGRIYDRARTVVTSLTRWLTVDPIWPRQTGYVYVVGNPTTYVDPLGLSPSESDHAACALTCYPYSYYIWEFRVRVGAPVCGYVTVIDIEKCICNPFSYSRLPPPRGYRPWRPLPPPPRPPVPRTPPWWVYKIPGWVNRTNGKWFFCIPACTYTKGWSSWHDCYEDCGTFCDGFPP